MYDLKVYKARKEEAVLDFIENHPFALICGVNASSKYSATHLPFLLDRREDGLYLQAHLMKHTEHYNTFLHNKDVLVVFSGPHCYISASWYTNPHSGSTWNYMSAHVYGKIRFMKDDELYRFMDKLTLKFESNNPESPTYIKNIPDDYVNKLMPAIVGIEIKVDKLEHTFKLSQDKDIKSFDTIIENLQKKDVNSQLVAEEMQKLKKT
jgi:transcriptional regulator